jgi:hypothetical protein
VNWLQQRQIKDKIQNTAPSEVGAHGCYIDCMSRYQWDFARLHRTDDRNQDPTERDHRVVGIFLNAAHSHCGLGQFRSTVL